MAKQIGNLIWEKDYPRSLVLTIEGWDFHNPDMQHSLSTLVSLLEADGFEVDTLSHFLATRGVYRFIQINKEHFDNSALWLATARSDNVEKPDIQVPVANSETIKIFHDAVKTNPKARSRAASFIANLNDLLLDDPAFRNPNVPEDELLIHNRSRLGWQYDWYHRLIRLDLLSYVVDLRRERGFDVNIPNVGAKTWAIIEDYVDFAQAVADRHTA